MYGNAQIPGISAGSALLNVVISDLGKCLLE